MGASKGATSKVKSKDETDNEGGSMKIISFSVENFKKIRLVEIAPKRRRTTITGKNGQGKTSILDAMWALFVGKRAIPDKPVRKGADKSKLSATLADDDGKPLLLIKRLVHGDRTTTVTVEAAPGAVRPAGTHQAVLDTLVGEMSFDPIAFIHLEPKKQVEFLLQTIVKVAVDLDALTTANEADYEERRNIDREAAALQTMVNAATYSPNLPADKIDEGEISQRIAAANEANRNMRTTFQIKNELGAKLGIEKAAVESNEATIARLAEEIEEAERQLELKKDALQAAHSVHAQLLLNVKIAEQTWNEAPSGELLDVQPLTDELATAQLTNREIDKRTRAQADQAKLAAKRARVTQLTRQMEERQEQKRAALANAQMPVEGLTFNEEGVFFKGLPLETLGEAEQIRVSLALAMASNPKLRAVPIARGESLDEDSLALIDQMAEEQDFQIFMARVDTSGKVGIVLSDGMVERVNE